MEDGELLFDAAQILYQQNCSVPCDLSSPCSDKSRAAVPLATQFFFFELSSDPSEIAPDAGCAQQAFGATQEHISTNLLISYPRIFNQTFTWPRLDDHVFSRILIRFIDRYA
jgi:hypothetical protein